MASLKNFSNDTDVTQQKFISQLVIRDQTWIYNFDSESEQQSMQWNERIGQNCHFIAVRNSVFFHVECKQPTNAEMHKLFKAQKSYCTCCVLSIATIRSKYYFNFILNRSWAGPVAVLGGGTAAAAPPPSGLATLPSVGAVH